MDVYTKSPLSMHEYEQPFWVRHRLLNMPTQSKQEVATGQKLDTLGNESWGINCAKPL